MRAMQQSWARQDAQGHAGADAAAASLDDVIRQFDRCRQAQQRPSLEALNMGYRLAGRAFRLNAASDPAVTALMQATARRIAREPGVLSAAREYDDLAEPQAQGASPDREENRALLQDGVERIGPREECVRVLEAMDAPVSNARRVAQAIGERSALGRFLLAVVNAPGVCLYGEVRFVQQAVALLGFEEVRTLVLAVAMLDRFRDSVGAMEAMLTGVFAHRISLAAGGGRVLGAAMLCHAGGVMVRNLLPQATERIRFLAARSLLSRHEAEAVVLGESMSAFGVRLLERWGASEHALRLTGMREDPARSQYEPAVCVAHLAEIMAQAALVDGGPAPAVSRLDSKCLRVLLQDPVMLGMDQRSALREAGALLEAARIR